MHLYKSWLTVVLLLLFFTTLTPAAALNDCIWIFPAEEGVTIRDTLTNKWSPAASCDARWLSFTPLPPVPSSFAMDSIHSPNFQYTPPLGSANTLVRVNVKVTCKIFTSMCNAAAVFFHVTPSATPLTTTTTTTTTTVPPTTTTTTTTAAPTTTTTTTPVPAPVETTTATNPVGTSATTPDGTTTAVGPSTTTMPTTTTTTEEATNTTTTTTTTTSEPATTTTRPPQGPITRCPVSVMPTQRAYIGSTTATTMDYGLWNADPTSNAFGVKDCPSGMSLIIIPDSATVTGNTTTANVYPSKLWSVTAGSTRLVFDTKGINAIEGVFSVGMQLRCVGTGLIVCNATQSVLAVQNLTAPPMPTAPSCVPVYGYTAYFNTTSTFALTPMEGESMCPSSTATRTFGALTMPRINPDIFTISPDGNFTYRGPLQRTVDNFMMGMYCNGDLYCVSKVFIEATSDTPAPTKPPTTRPPPPPPTPAPIPRCPHVYNTMITAPVVSYVASFPLTGYVGETPCNNYKSFSMYTPPTNGMILTFDNNTGKVNYLTPSSFNKTTDSFSFIITCATSVVGPWQCLGTMNLFLKEGNVTTPPTGTTLPPGGIFVINDQLTCSGSCMADEVLKVVDDMDVFDINNTLGPVAGTSRSDGMPIGTIDYSITAEGKLLITAYGKIGNVLSGRIPTFDIITPNVPFTSASVPTGADGVYNPAIPFNASCLDLQSRYGIAEELWEWTNISEYKGHAVGNYASDENVFQKFGGKHDHCDTFRRNSCKYAPTLTPATVASTDDLQGVQWHVTITGCDETWTAELSAAQIRALQRPQSLGGHRLFHRTSDKTFASTIYSQVFKPKRWHPPFRGVDTIYTENPVVLGVGGLLSVDTQYSGMTTPVYPPNTTEAPTTATATTAVMPPPATTTSTSSSSSIPTPAGHRMKEMDFSDVIIPEGTQKLIMPGDSENTTSNSTTDVTMTTAIPTTTPTTTMTTTTPTPMMNVTIQSDIQYYSSTNSKQERTYGYNLLLYPAATDLQQFVDFSSLFVTDVLVLSSEFSAPAKRNCPSCSGTLSSCTAIVKNTQQHRAMIVEEADINNTTTSEPMASTTTPTAPVVLNSNTTVSSCVDQTTGEDQALVQVTTGPVAATHCAEISDTAASVRYGPIAGVSAPQRCPQVYYNITLRAVVRGNGTAAEVGQPQGTLRVQVTLSNGQVFTSTISQSIYLSQVARSESALVSTSVCRTTAYWPVKDPFGPSTATNQYRTVPYSSAEGGTGMMRDECPAPQELLDDSATANRGTAENASLTMTSPQGDEMCIGGGDNTLAPTDWAFVSLRSNGTIDYMTLTVSAAEVVPNPTQPLFTFYLTGNAAGTTLRTQALPWKQYAASLNFRSFLPTVDTDTMTHVHSFAFIPGTLLRPGASARVVFTLEAVVVNKDPITGKLSTTTLRHVLTVSSMLSPEVRKDAVVDPGRDFFGFTKDLRKNIAEIPSGHAALLLALALGGGVIALGLIAACFDNSARKIVLDQHAIVMSLIKGNKEAPSAAPASPIKVSQHYPPTARDNKSNNKNSSSSNNNDNKKPEPPIPPFNLREFQASKRKVQEELPRVPQDEV